MRSLRMEGLGLKDLHRVRLLHQDTVQRYLLKRNSFWIVHQPSVQKFALLLNPSETWGNLWETAAG